MNTHISTGVMPLDTVLCGGLPLFGLVLLEGAPGVGKTTLLLEVMACLRAAKCGAEPLFTTTEGSKRDATVNAKRLGFPLDHHRVQATRHLGTALERARALDAKVWVIDSLNKLTGRSGYEGQDEIVDVLAQEAHAGRRSIVVVRQTRTVDSKAFIIGHRADVKVELIPLAGDTRDPKRQLLCREKDAFWSVPL